MEADVYEGFAERLAAKYPGNPVTVIHDGEHMHIEVQQDHPAARVLDELVNGQPLASDQPLPARPLRQRGTRTALTDPFSAAER